jgi:hypothetical protein
MCIKIKIHYFANNTKIRSCLNEIFNFTQIQMIIENSGWQMSEIPASSGLEYVRRYAGEKQYRLQ